jgi:hypothetical protein
VSACAMAPTHTSAVSACAMTPTHTSTVSACALAPTQSYRASPGWRAGTAESLPRIQVTLPAAGEVVVVVSRKHTNSLHRRDLEARYPETRLFCDNTHVLIRVPTAPGCDRHVQHSQLQCTV